MRVLPIALVLATVSLAERDAEACSPIFDCPLIATSLEGRALPANTPAIPVEEFIHLVEDGTFDSVPVERVDAQTFELIVPAALEPGAGYQLRATERCGDAEDARFTVTEPRALPTEAPRVAPLPPEIDERMTGMPCVGLPTGKQTTARFPLLVGLAEDAVPFAATTRVQVTDVATGEVVAVSPYGLDLTPEGEFVFDELFIHCGGRSAAGAIEPGTYRFRVALDLAGAPAQPEAVELEMKLDCNVVPFGAGGCGCGSPDAGLGAFAALGLVAAIRRRR